MGITKLHFRWSIPIHEKREILNRAKISRYTVLHIITVTQYAFFLAKDINDEVYDGIKQETPRSIDNMMKGWFKFVQMEDGSIPAVFHSKSEDSAAVNFKKTIATAFQANFEGTASKMEADSQSMHKAKYT